MRRMGLGEGLEMRFEEESCNKYVCVYLDDRCKGLSKGIFAPCELILFFRRHLDPL